MTKQPNPPPPPLTMRPPPPPAPPTFITKDQRQKFQRWSLAINRLDDATKANEGETWIAAAMAILKRPNTAAQPLPTQGDHQ